MTRACGGRVVLMLLARTLAPPYYANLLTHVRRAGPSLPDGKPLQGVPAAPEGRSGGIIQVSGRRGVAELG